MPSGIGYGTLVWFIHNTPVSQSVGYFTVPPRAHPSTGSQSGSAAPGSLGSGMR